VQRPLSAVRALFERSISALSAVRSVQRSVSGILGVARAADQQCELYQRSLSGICALSAHSADLAGMGGGAGKTSGARGPADRAQSEGQDGRRSLFKPANHDGSPKAGVQAFQVLSKGSEETRVAKAARASPRHPKSEGCGVHWADAGGIDLSCRSCRIVGPCAKQAAVARCTQPETRSRAVRGANPRQPGTPAPPRATTQPPRVRAAVLPSRRIVKDLNAWCAHWSRVYR
jgi:hypothetical protein